MIVILIGNGVKISNHVGGMCQQSEFKTDPEIIFVY
jgi:hypothetical protein